MQVVKAERWHKVETSRPRAGAASRRCSVCGSQHLAPHGDPVLDGVTLARYQVVRCEGCGYDLLEMLVPELVGTHR
jgi:hypothetical protein